MSQPSPPGFGAAPGELPPAAVHRLAELARSGAFTSDLSTQEFTAVESVGFHPVGQVMGSCVYQIGFAGGGGCGYPGGLGLGAGLRSGWWGASAAWQGYAPLVSALYDARHRAMERARREAAELGGDGVVAVRLTMQPFDGAADTIEFQAIGTAVRARGRHRPPRPFLSDLSGQDFAKLLSAGWVPVDLAVGIAVQVRHDDFRTVQAASLFNRVNVEVPGYSELVQRARAAAREALARDVLRVRAHGAVVAAMDLRIRARECQVYGGGRDHVAEATLIGTAVARVPGRGRPPPVQALLPLRGASDGG